MSKMGQISKEFQLSNEQRTSLLDEMRKVLIDANWHPENHALEIIIDKWVDSKGWLINMFSQHPNWNPDKFQIQFDQDFTRSIDLDTLEGVFSWAISEYGQFLIQTQIKIAGMTYSEIKRSIHKVLEIINLESCIRNEIGVSTRISVNGREDGYYENEYIRLNRILDRFQTDTIKCICDFNNYNYAISSERYEMKQKLEKFSNIIKNYFSENSDNLCPVDLCDNINELFSGTARERQKISKIIAKVFNKLGLDKIQDIRQVTHNGVVMDKDFGWQMKQAELGDAINPLKYARHTIISLNPIDYLTMSYGYRWTSCHCIDSKRDNRYSGEYCGGTVSYMLDPSSFIFYTVDSKYEGDEFELQDKMQRAVFAAGEDKLYEGRVYPDGRDGGDQGLAAQFRNVVQTVVADCLSVNNVWVNKKGTEPCKNAMISLGGLAYEDWKYCEDSNMSYLKGEGGNINTECFYINEEAIDIKTGDVNNDHSVLSEDGVMCERCGCRINLEDDDYVEIDGCYYCDYECAEEAGYRYCEDSMEWISEDEAYYDDYSGTWFEYIDDMIIINDYYFSCPEHAELYGFVYCSNTENWIIKSDSFEDNYTGEDFEWTDDSVETEDGHYYVNAKNSELDGYHLNANGDWVLNDEEEEAS